MLFRSKDARPSTFAGRLTAGTITFLVIVIGWVFFRAANVSTALRILRGMIHLSAFSPSEAIGALRQIAWITALLAVAWFAPNSQQLLASHGPALHEVAPARWSWQPTQRWALCIAIIFILAVLHLSQISEFIYFQF